MRSIWFRMSVGRQVLVVLLVGLFAAGTALAAVAWLGAEHGSDAFNGLMAWSRTLLQLAGVIGVVALLAIASRASKKRY